MTPDQTIQILKYAWPLIVLQIGLQIYAIVDLVRKNKTKNLSVPIWVVIIVLGEIIGSILYFLIGRSEE